MVLIFYFLGYGDPGAAHYSRMPDTLRTMDWNDTFLDMEHLKSCFPEHKIKATTDDEKKLVRPFKLTFDEEMISVEPHVIPSRGPYLFNEPKKYVTKRE